MALPSDLKCPKPTGGRLGIWSFRHPLRVLRTCSDSVALISKLDEVARASTPDALPFQYMAVLGMFSEYLAVLGVESAAPGRWIHEGRAPRRSSDPPTTNLIASGQRAAHPSPP
ncbi:MAG: hypothetical protein ACI841_005263, partial [Planctomycetota bacterium]